MLLSMKDKGYIFTMEREELTTEIGKRLQMLRGNIAYKTIADTIGENTNTIWYWFNGINRAEFEGILKLAEFFHVSVDYILRGDNSPIAKNEKEKATLQKIREADKRGMSEAADEIFDFVLERPAKYGPRKKEGSSIPKKRKKTPAA